MKSLKIYQVDAFVEGPFSGNPAAVCPLDEWLSDELMQGIALENNLSETAFYVKKEGHYELRWFTPTIEVDLCGHATLATAFVLFEKEGHTGNEIQFISPRSGDLSVAKKENLYTINFPADVLQEVSLSDNVLYGLNIDPLKAFRGNTDVILIFKSEEDIIKLKPDFSLLAKIEARGVICTAPGNNEDFVSRFFGPNAGVNEDPVTGSAHTSLTPLWAKRLDKDQLTARQLSQRGGYLECQLLNDRVAISGRARLYLEGSIMIDEH
jgi:PhzF family phenazine biosynthesis protein